MFKVSIIIPVYNAEKTLDRCLKSISAQSYHNFEVILVNDGSKDGSKDICDHFSMSDRRFKAIHISNGGVSNARNIGLKECKGEYVTFIDADDEITPQYLNLLLKGGEVDLAVCGYKSIFVDGSVAEEILEPIQNGHVIKQLNNLINHRLVRTVWGKLFKRSLIFANNLKFDPSIKLGEDTIFVLQYITYLKSIRICNQICYIYYKAPPNINRYSSSPDELLYIYSNFQSIENKLINLKYDVHALRESNLKTIYFYYFNLIYSSGEFRKADRLKYYRKLIGLTGEHRLFFINDKLSNILTKHAPNKSTRFGMLDASLIIYFYFIKLKAKLR